MASTEDRDFDDYNERVRAARRRQLIGAFITFDVVIVLVAIIPWLLGYGFFAHRAFDRSPAQVFVFNNGNTAHEAWVVLNGPLAQPTNRVPVAPYTVQMLETIRAPQTLHVRSTQGGEQLRSWPIDPQAGTLINLDPEMCMVVFDITPMYQGAPDDTPALPIVARIPAGQAVWYSDAERLIPPRRPLPSRATGTIHWAEDFGCDLLEPELEELLIVRAGTRLQDRMARPEPQTP